MKNNKKILLDLEKSGNYVFHGSDDGRVKVFEPRQAFDFVNGKKTKDDKPGVHASPLVDVAIFMSLLSGKNCPKGFSSSFKLDRKKVVFGASKEGIDQLRQGNAVGYVYVFDKSFFKKRQEIEYICYEKIYPLQKLEVHLDDLPQNIKVIPDFKK